MLFSAFLMEGPLLLLRMWYGWLLAPHLQLSSQEMVFMVAHRWLESWCRRSERNKYPILRVFDHATRDIHIWKDELSLHKPAQFTEAGLQKEAAQTLLTCLEEWCALNRRELPWYYAG